MQAELTDTHRQMETLKTELTKAHLHTQTGNYASFPPFRCVVAVPTSHLPLCRNCRSVENRIESHFCRSAVGAARLTANQRSGHAKAERQRNNGTAQRHNGMATAERNTGN